MQGNISLLSWQFLGLSVAVVLLSNLLKGVARQLVLLACSIAFLLGLLGVTATVALAGFGLLGYVIIINAQWLWRGSLLLIVAALVTLFAYMRNYEFLQWFIAENMLVSTLKVAGLSFLFFKILHVIVEARSGTLGEFDFLTYVNYCFGFWTFTMGPIQRYQDFSQQWHGQSAAIELRFDAHLDAMIRVLFGLVRVYVLAYVFKPYALAPFEEMSKLSLPSLLLYIYAFNIFLYFNFAGYCDVVIGIGSLLGVRPPENFNNPFLATNISDFWLRQHRSLTLWLKDYIFTPSLKGALSTGWLGSRPLLAANLCLMMTMIVSGLWHGATLNFLVFGVVHGLFLVIHYSWGHLLGRWLGKKRVRTLRKSWIGKCLAIAITFNAVSFAFLFFRLNTAESLSLMSRFLEPWNGR